MKTAPAPALVTPARRLLVAVCAAFGTLAGCATTEPQHPAPEQRPAATAPAPVPAGAPVANFAPALRCMDTLLADYGVRDVTVMVDDLADQSKGSAGNAKEMLTAVVAGMTQRSRAIRVIASGKDWGNTATALAAMKREQFAVVPQYALRGTLSLQDGQVTRRGSETFANSQLGVDLSLVTTQDFSVVPGVGSRNTATLYKQGRGYDGRGDLQKFGVTFALASPSNQMPADATRALVELGTIELFGRLARVPYWTCLGMSEAHAGVSAEIQDWYDTMATQPVELIKYFQTQLRLRRLYEGPIDGAANAGLKDAVARYREALGLPREAKLSLDFFRAYLNADHAQVAAVLNPPAAPVQVATIAQVPPANYAPVAPAPVAASGARPVSTAAGAGATPGTTSVAPATAATAAASASNANALSLRIGTVNDARRFARGEAVQLAIRPSRDAHVYCFMQDENRKIMRFFPNRFQRDSRVPAADGLKLPGAMPFAITMNARGVQETVACFATERDVMAQLPASFGAGDFDPLPITSLEQVKTAFAKAAPGAVAQEMFLIQGK